MNVRSYICTSVHFVTNQIYLTNLHVVTIDP